jgi:hypothetical protein
VQRLRASIAGREREPAGRVFKNIRFELFKTVPAADLLDIMSGGYSHALGVTCTHCHVETDFSSDEKRPKRAARAMARCIDRSIRRSRRWTTSSRIRRIASSIAEPATAEASHRSDDPFAKALAEDDLAGPYVSQCAHENGHHPRVALEDGPLGASRGRPRPGHRHRPGSACGGAAAV